MALPALTEQQVQTLTLEEKDRWWLENVYKGDVPQFTLRAVIVGFLLGAVLSVTNLYIGAKTGWALGVGITSVVLAFLFFKTLEEIGFISRYHVLETNIVQSIACAAGYTNGPLIASMAAYMVIENRVIPRWQMILWCFGLGVMGVLYAFPLKRRFINEEQLPFPEGQAAGVVMDTLHSEEGDAAARVLPAKLLVISSAIAALITFAQAESIMERMKLKLLTIPEVLDDWYYRLAERSGWWIPNIKGIPLNELTLQPVLDLSMIGAGGLMGIRTGVSMLIGSILCYGLIAPYMILSGDIPPIMREGIATYGFRHISTKGTLWCGVTMMTTASLVAFFSKPSALIQPIRELFGGERERNDPLRKIEFPIWISIVGVPIVGAALVWMASAFYGVKWWMAAIAVPMVFVFTIIAVNSTGLTSVTPTGPMGKITQLIYGVIANRQMHTNIVTACITAEVAGSASNLIQNIKPGYQLGGKPRLQAMGHILGVVAGSVASVLIFYWLFLKNDPAGLITAERPYPAASVWKAVAELLAKGLSELTGSARMFAVLGGVLGIGLELTRIFTKGKFWLSPVAVGLAFTMTFSIAFAMFMGSFLFWLAAKIWRRPEQGPNRVLVQNQESICAGIIAGASLMGVAVMAIKLLVLHE